MTIFKCKMCGADLEIVEDSKVCECEYCGSTQTIPSLDNEKKINLFTRANRLRMACEFDKAAGVYESIVSEFQDEAEAYWGLILCKYGIEYVDDPRTGKKIPTCHRSSFDSVMEDSNFEMVMECGDIQSRLVYREEAKAIEKLRTDIIEVSSKEEPYDIFICYKETDEHGDRTIDSVIAQDVYGALTEKGYKVFFSRITLEDKLGQEYEPYIFSALNSAKVMLAFGTDYEYYNAVWVKNEWSRFLSLIEKGEKKTLIPCYKDIDAYDMPNEFKRLQAQDMGKVGAIQDLVRGIQKIIIPKGENSNSIVDKDSIDKAIASALSQKGDNLDILLKRGKMSLEDEEWGEADNFFEQILNQNPENSYAYLGKFLAKVKCKNIDEVTEISINSFEDKNYKRAVLYADKELKDKFDLIKQIIEIKKDKRFIIVGKILKKCNAEYDEIIHIPNVIEIIEKDAFLSCRFLEELIIPESVVLIQNWSLYKSTRLKKITVDEGNRVYYSEDGVLFSRNEKELIGYPIDKPDEEYKIPLPIRKIGDGAFWGCDKIRKITISENVVNIGERAFSNCKNLLDFEVDNNENYECLDGVLYSKDLRRLHIYPYGKKLKEYNVPNEVICIDRYAFDNNENLIVLNIPNTVMDIGDNAFETKNSKFTVVAEKDSFCQSYCKKNNILVRTEQEWLELTINSKRKEFVLSLKSYAFSRETELRKYMDMKKNAYDIYVKEINIKREAELNVINEYYNKKRELLQKEKRECIEKRNNRSRELSDSKRELVDRRSKLGIFNKKEKEIIGRQIEAIDNSLSQLETDEMIDNKYKINIKDLNYEQMMETNRKKEELNSKYAIISFDEFRV